MAKTIILKNTTGANIEFTTFGATLLASSQRDFGHLSSIILANDSILISAIQSGDIIVNDGVNDLSATNGELYVKNDFLLEIDDSSSTISKFIKKLKFDSGLLASEITSGSAGIDAGVPTHLLYVFTTGNNTTGDGSLAKPYLTISHALSTISGSGPSNRFVIIVGPGIYAEDNPLIIPTFVEVVSLSNTPSSQITASNSALNLFEVSGITALKGLTLDTSGGTGAFIYQNDASGFCTVDDVVLGNNGIGIDCSNGTIAFNGLTVTPGSTITNEVLLAQAGGKIFGIRYGVENVTTAYGARATGSGSTLNITNATLSGSGVSHGFFAENSSTMRVANSILNDLDISLRVATSAELSLSAVAVESSNIYDLQIDDTTPTLRVTGSEFRRDKVSVPSNYTKVSGFYLNEEPTVAGLRVLGDIVAGRPELGTKLAVGRGDSYTRGMIVLTTDNTATSTTEGGNLTDVSAEAASYSGSTYSFQGITANHTILFGCDIDEDGDKVKFFGLDVDQTIAAVETTRKSFVFESWNGTQWEEFGVMAVYFPEAYVYSKEVFIRANQDEHLLFGINDNSTWAKKTINSKNLYWIRVRITDDLVTAPVFEQTKLISSHLHVNNKGIIALCGEARYKRTILSTGNIFGESGAITYSNPFVGATGGWDHFMKNNQLNEINDSLYLQFVLPRGVDTSFPLEVIVYYQDLSGTASSDGTLRISALPMEVVGVLAADETGGTVPIARTLGDINPITTDNAQIIDSAIVLGNANVISTIRDNLVDISDAYEGDMVAVKIEYLDDGNADKNIVIWGVEISAVAWVLGDRV